MSNILVVENNLSSSRDLEKLLLNLKHRVETVDDYDNALQALTNSKYDIIMMGFDSTSPKPEQYVRKIKDENTNTALVLYTSRDNHVQVNPEVRDNIDDLLTYPFHEEKLNISLQSILRRYHEEAELLYLRHERGLIYNFKDIIHESRKMKELLEMVEKVVQTDTTVLITGETGTGKELIAGAVHHNSPRKSKPFIKVNCAALPENLLESELFGHEKGAFTGAYRQRVGRVEQADGGTLFLDEISEMSLGMQTKLLRVLQQREFERVGGTQTIRVDIRLIAATNKNLKEMIDKGEFREDLYYRLNVFSVRVPPIRERGDDVLLLADYFLIKYSRQFNKPIKGFTERSNQLMKNYTWPGNVRELNNAIERAVILSDKEQVITPKELGLSESASFIEPNKALPITIPPEGIRLKDVEKQLILQALDMTNWVQKDAARLLGMSKRALNYRVKQHKITHTSWFRNK